MGHLEIFRRFGGYDVAEIFRGICPGAVAPGEGRCV